MNTDVNLNVQQPYQYDYIKRSSYWHQYNWHLTQDYFFDEEETKGFETKTLGEILESLEHNGREIKFITTTLEDLTLPLLQQIVTYRHSHNILQVAMKIQIQNHYGPTFHSSCVYRKMITLVNRLERPYTSLRLKLLLFTGNTSTRNFMRFVMKYLGIDQTKS